VKDIGYSFKFSGGSCVRLIKGTLEENGFSETTGKNWTILWNSGPIKTEVYMGLFAYQKVCHFPKSYEMTRKDLMHRNVSKMQIQHGVSNIGFIPKTYILPAEMSYFLEEHDKIKSQVPLYICKPHASS
jgi:tubulin polyglutamylase TTLL5